SVVGWPAMPGWGQPSGPGRGWSEAFSTASTRKLRRGPTNKATSRANRVTSPANNQSLSEEGGRHANEAKRTADGRLLAGGGAGDAAGTGPGAAEEPR